MSDHRVCMRCNKYFLRREDDSPNCLPCTNSQLKARVSELEAEVAKYRFALAEIASVSKNFAWKIADEALKAKEAE